MAISEDYSPEFPRRNPFRHMAASKDKLAYVGGRHNPFRLFSCISVSFGEEHEMIRNETRCRYKTKSLLSCLEVDQISPKLFYSTP